MKKVLFATTALVATAGVAAADVTFGGYGRFGVLYTSSTDAVAGAPASAGYAGARTTAAASATALEAAEQAVIDAATPAAQAAAITARDAAAATAAADQTALDAETAGSEGTAASDSSVDITSRFRLQIDASTDTDTGVTFGARTRLEGEERDGAAGNRPQFSGVRYFARSGGVEVGVGNIFGAIGSMPGQYPIDLGLTGLSYGYAAAGVGGFDEFSSGGLGASGSNGVELMYSAGDFQAHISASDTNDRVAAHAAYTFSGWTIALGLQDSDLATDVETTVSVGGSLGAASVNLAWAETAAGRDRTVLAVGYEIGAATDLEFYAADDSANGSSFGIGFNHDLGGGVSIQGGYDDNYGNAIADLGVRFNF